MPRVNMLGLHHHGGGPVRNGLPSKYNDHDIDLPSTWLVAPYFLLYFVMYIINTVVWPLQMMERACISLLPEGEAVKYAFDNHEYTAVTNSCISYYISNPKQTDAYITNNANNITLNIMIVAAFGGGLVSLLAYFLIWKPLLTRWRSVALFLPPVCMICQSLILMQAQTIVSFDVYKYTVLSSVLLPSLHSSFQGVFLQLFHMSDIPEVKSNREILTTRLDGSQLVIFVAILFSGSFVAGCFDLSYNLVFFLQFTLGSVHVMYALTLLPSSGACMDGVEEEDEDENEDEEKKDDAKGEDGKKEKKVTIKHSDSSEEEESFFLGDMVKSTKDGNERINLLKEAPLIFSETSYKRELIVIIEISVFTAAIISDTSISGLYFVQSPFTFDLRTFGGLIAIQGFIKIVGMLFIKTFIRYSQVKHGTLIFMALLNYIGYYIALSVAHTKLAVTIVMFTNVFGSLALPTLFSFIKVNLRETEDTVLELSVISSLVVTMGFSAIQFFVYQKTRELFQGAIFVITASLLGISGIIILATYLSTSKKNQRRSKYFADQLLNSNN